MSHCYPLELVYIAQRIASCHATDGFPKYTPGLSIAI